jgi:hypothetical protein
MKDVLKYHGNAFFLEDGSAGGACRIDPSRNSMQCLHLMASS